MKLKRQSEDDMEGKTPISGADRKIAMSPARTFFWLGMVMSVYALLRLSSSKLIFPAAILLLSILEALRLVREYEWSARIETMIEIAYFVVLLSAFLGVYRNTFADHPAFMFATIFYRPFYTAYGSRRLAFIVSVLIVAVVLPVTCGLVTYPDLVQVFTGLYVVLVLSLWIFCSEVGARIFQFERNR